ncbi:MAG TPA: NAD-dependent epimerase/dehydratase family protein [Candidatus Elarobacter sp.]|nr:NAD-dependent epimerase/dehydratase family protein [Candidatus Elarobacter sp.]
MRARRVLLTGAAGFVGIAVARRLAERGHEVHAAVRPASPSWRLRDLRRHAVAHEADLLDPSAIAPLFARVRPEWVVHLAAYGAYPSQTDVERCVRTNLEASVRLIDAAAAGGVERFVNTGSSSEYGLKDHAPGEDEPLEPNSLYAVTKAAATAYARHAARSAGLHATTLRLYSVYGPYEEPTRLIPATIAHGLRGAYPPLVAPGVARDFVYVDDVAAAYEAALGAEIPAGAVYNVGSGVQTTLREVAAVSRARFGIPAEPAWGTMAPRTWDTTTWVANTARTRAELRWQAATCFEDGFRRTAAWLSESAERRSFYETHRTPPR